MEIHAPGLPITSSGPPCPPAGRAVSGFLEDVINRSTHNRLLWSYRAAIAVGVTMSLCKATQVIGMVLLFTLSFAALVLALVLLRRK